MRRRIALAAVLVALVLLWQPLLRPAYKGAVILLDVYTTTLFQRNLAALVTPPPRYEDEPLTLAGTTMRVSWWRPAWGGRHPAILLVNGASTAGNDMPEIRMISDAVARAGYLVMLPEFPFLKEERLEAAAVDQIDAAFAVLRAHDASRPPVGAFGFSVGGGVLLAAGGRGWALRDARYVGVLGVYYDIDAYLASVVSASQRRGDAIVPWAQTADVRRRFSSAAAHALASIADRELLLAELRATDSVLPETPPDALGAEGRALWLALAARDHDEALGRLERLPPSVREVFDRLSPRPVWDRIAAPIFWLHDANDGYVPVSQADAAAATRSAPLRLVVPRLLAHGDPVSPSARQEGPLFWISELARLLGFAMDVLRAAD